MPRRKRRSLLANFDFALVRKDWLTALGVWICLEVLSFVLLPRFQLIEAPDKSVIWFLTSVPLGLMGSLLIGLSSEFIQRCQDDLVSQHNKRLLIGMGQVASWLGLAGVLFPLFIVALEMWVKLTNATTI